jgi:hypothetical protein
MLSLVECTGIVNLMVTVLMTMLSHCSSLGCAAVYSGMWHVLSILSAHHEARATKHAVQFVFIYGYSDDVKISHCMASQMVQLVVNPLNPELNPIC